MYRTEGKDSDDIIFIVKTSRYCTFSFFKLIFMGTIVRKEIYSPFQIYILCFVWVKINGERDVFILAGGYVYS